MAPAHLVVVDDDADLQDMLAEYLTKQGFVAHTASDGEALRALMAQQSVSLVILDIHLPGEDGLSLARLLREHYDVGIIMLTAADEVTERIVGLEMGADDYLPKPFDPREVVARIQSVLRRRCRIPARQPEYTKARQWQRLGRCLLDDKSHTLQTINGERVPLTAMEFALLQTLSTHPQQILSRSQLFELAHEREWDPDDRSLDIRIARLRRKIEVDPKKPQVIKTVYGMG